MEKIRWTYLQLFLKVVLILYIIFIFACGNIRGSIVTTYAMNSNHDAILPLPPIPLLNPTPSPTPIPASSPLPTSVASQPSQTGQTSQAQPVPTRQGVQLISTATGISAPATPTRSPVSATASAGITTMIPPFLTHPFLQGRKDMNALTLSLTIGVGGPLLLIIGGILWLLVRWQIKLFTASSNVASGYTLKSDSPPLPMDTPEPTSAGESDDNGDIPFPPASVENVMESLPAPRE